MIGPNSLYSLESLIPFRRQDLLAEAAEERLLRSARSAVRRRVGLRSASGVHPVAGISMLSLLGGECCPRAA